MSELKNILHFSRLHTVVGTTISVTALYLISLAQTEPTDRNIALWLLSLISCLGANIYIVGLNQLVDIGIDRINKPYLPLASGAWSVRKARIIIFSSLALSLFLALFLGPWLLLTVALSLLLGTAYSLPPIRLKRFTFWAAFCIVAVRGLIVNIFLFLHFQSEINDSLTIPPAIWWLTGIIFIYSIVIAWFKDIPDMEGDRQYRIRTLSLKLGARTVFLAGNALLILALVFTIYSAGNYASTLDSFTLRWTHIAIVLALVVAATRVRLGDRHSIFTYYRFIWILFFAEYIAFTLAAAF